MQLLLESRTRMHAYTSARVFWWEKKATAMKSVG